MTWMFYALLSAISAAGVAIFGKIGIEKIDTTLATTVRSIVMAVLLVLTSLALGKFNNLEALQGRPLTFIALSGLAGALSWFFYFLALKTGPASGVAAIDRTSVVFVFILAILFLGESLTLKSGVGAVLITLGVIMVAFK